MKKFLRTSMLALAIGAMCITSAFAAQTLTSQRQTIIVDRTYQVWSTMVLRQALDYEATAWLQADSRFPRATVGLDAKLYNRSNQVVASTGFIYNTVEDNLFYTSTPTKYYPNGELQAGGDVCIYDGVSNIYRGIPRTSFALSSRSASEAVSLTEGLDKDGNYPVNKQGETYGSELQAEITGEKPDLIAAVGTKGESGYIRESEVNPVMNSPEEALAYMETLPASRTVPLYNAEGVKIGEFLVETGEQPSEEEIQHNRAFGEAGLKLQKIGENGYAVNQRGETYGPELEEMDKPDLIAVVATNGQSGYACREDLSGPVMKTPAEAAAYMKTLPSSRTIPVFDAEHETQIGEFLIAVGPGPSSAEVQLQRQLSMAQK